MSLSMACLPDDLQGGLQIFDLKQLADMEARYKDVCKKAMADYKTWWKGFEGETDTIALLYGKLEGNLLRAHAQESVNAYWTIRQDFRKWFHCYLAQTNCYPSNNN